MATGVRFPEINFIVLAGNATRDGEHFTTSAGTQKTTIRMAVSRRYKDPKSGEWKDQAFFIDVVVWGQAAERAKERAKKGVAMTVEGRLSARDYEDKSGQKRTVFEVVANRVQFLSQPGEGAGAGKPEKSQAAGGESAGEAAIEEAPF
jgi:single-strand DNA-binding protein